jgi:hypothetical protein
LAIEEEVDFEDVEGTNKKGAGEEEKELYNWGLKSSMGRFIVNGDQ